MSAVSIKSMESDSIDLRQCIQSNILPSPALRRALFFAAFLLAAGLRDHRIDDLHDEALLVLG